MGGGDEDDGTVNCIKLAKSTQLMRTGNTGHRYSHSGNNDVLFEFFVVVNSKLSSCLHLLEYEQVSNSEPPIKLFENQIKVSAAGECCSCETDTFACKRLAPGFLDLPSTFPNFSPFFLDFLDFPQLFSIS